jgi:hypothetical protein
MASTNAFFISGGINSPKALSYLSNTLSLVKRRMQGEEALSDSTLCIVMMLILQEQIRHEEASQIHYEGLRKMIKLRGGLSQLESCPTLLLKMSKLVLSNHTLHSHLIWYWFTEWTYSTHFDTESQYYSFETACLRFEVPYYQWVSTFIPV